MVPRQRLVHAAPANMDERPQSPKGEEKQPLISAEDAEQQAAHDIARNNHDLFNIIALVS
jgi:hypothetical protein